ncbi:MAG TPA: ATP-binding cassette domain-containing protein [Bacteroidia bacterium]|jgi:phospholipid/cholesterol/gamma-HCH transport system ATP-binding protein|nr:ATP-binding cassette domain-containing protein [Bacteroidia bacterium]
MSTTETHTLPDAVIEITQLKKSFGNNHVLQGIDFKLGHGENVVVLGRSGCGKSVFIKCISGLVKSDSGTIKIFNQNIFGINNRQLDKIREKIGFLFQSNALYDSMTIRKNLEFPLVRHLKLKSKEEINSRVEEALSNVGLLNTIDMMPSELSGGMRKRIGLARALIMKPEIMLYDEPTTGLDPITAKEISNLMLDMQKKYNTSSIIISHDMNCAKITANRLLVLIDGNFYAEGTYEELKQSNDEKIKAFFE